jgi:hypothetical protein
MNAKEALQVFREVFPGSMVQGKDEAILPTATEKPIFCNYHDRLRPVDEPVCQHHLETFDPWCWERCNTEWTIKRYRPPLSGAYRQHKDSTHQGAASPSANGARGSLWGR